MILLAGVLGLRDSFGGLCVKLSDLTPAIYNAEGAQVYVDPWNDWEDGTCALPTPTGLSVSTGSDFLDVQRRAGPPNGNGNDAVTGYEVEWKSGDQAFGDPARTASVTGLSYTIEGLTNGTRYGIRVRAVNDDGGRGHWAETNRTVGAAIGTLPAPQNLAAVAGTNRLTVTWDRVVQGGTGPDAVTGYEVQWQSWHWIALPWDSEIVAAEDAASLSHVLEGLSQPYRVRVRALAGLDRDWNPHGEWATIDL